MVEDEKKELLASDPPKSTLQSGTSIYTAWEPVRNRILLISSLAPVLNPLTGSFFLPALPSIIEEFNSTQLQTALVYSLYFLVVAIAKLVWGPFIDKYSRKWCLIIALLQFILFTYITAYSFDMWFLIFCRTITGIPMSSYFVISSAIISDIYPPNKRGFAMGMRSVPMLVNTIFGAPIGGLLTLYVGWRSTLATLSICGTIVYLLVLFYIPETLNTEKAKKIPLAPLAPIKLVFKPKIFCITLAGGVSLSSMFLTMFCLSTVVADIYDLNAFVLGLIIVPSGVSSIIFSTIGGKISDILGRNYGRGARLVFSTLSLLLGSLMLIPFAWSFDRNVYAPIVLSVVAGALRGASGPGFSTFCIEEYPQNVSAVLAGASSGYMIMSFLLLFIAPLVATSIGWVWVCTLFAIVSFCICIPCIIIGFIAMSQYLEKLPTKVEKVRDIQ